VQEALDNAVLVLNQQLNGALRTFAKNISVAIEQNEIRKKITYHDVFVDFKVSLEDLVEIALEINPKSINLHRNNKDKGKATVRQVVSYIAGNMGYTDQAIAAHLGSSRSTITIARKRVEDALLYNEVPMRKLYNTFLEKLRKHPNSEILDYVINT
jgi:hypothetical protein